MGDRSKLGRLSSRRGKAGEGRAGADAGRKSFESIYTEYYPRVRAYLISKTGFYNPNLSSAFRVQIAEDLAQEVMVAVYRNYGSYDSSRASLSTWIFVIARNRLVNYLSRELHCDDSVEEKEDYELPKGEELVESAAEFEELAIVLRDEVSKLDERERAIIQGFFYEGKTNIELADELQMTASNVGVVKKRTLAKLRLSLAMRGYEA